MSWFVRKKDYADIYKPRECPDYPDIQLISDVQWTFISDRQKGLINALESVLPGAEHRFCVMHLYQNMHKDYKGIALRHLLWKSARATTNWEFNKHMEQMEKISKKCHDWLQAKPRQQWSRSAFKTLSRCDMFVNNHCEVFNSSIRKFRDLPIITMLREIHKAVMKRIQVRRDKMVSKDIVICPSAQRKLDKAIHFAGGCVVTWSGGTAYSITCSDGGHELVVDLFKKTCTCRKWDLTGIPCYHAAACINFKNDPWEKHINACYTKKCYMNLYNHTLHPIVGPEFWEQTDYPRPLPPLIKPQTGRPKKKKVRRNDIPTNQADPTGLNARVNTMVNCTYCKGSGHNCRTCPSNISDQAAQGVPLQPKKKGTVKCKACGNTGHNSRTCKKEVEGTEKPRPQEGITTEEPRPQEGNNTEKARPQEGTTT